MREAPNSSQGIYSALSLHNNIWVSIPPAEHSHSSNISCHIKWKSRETKGDTRGEVNKIIFIILCERERERRNAKQKEKKEEKESIFLGSSMRTWMSW